MGILVLRRQVFLYSKIRFTLIVFLRNHFFDGLKQFGRDFGKIKRYMAQKMQKGTQIKVFICFQMSNELIILYFF